MSDKKSPSYVVTVMLAALPTGWIGLHHYYVGNTKRGVIYTLFIWTGVPAILCFIDLIILSRRGQEEFLQKHGTEETLNKYYYNELKSRRPDLVAGISPEDLSDGQMDNLEDKGNDSHNAEEGDNEANSTQEDKTQNSEDEDDEQVTRRYVDYSDYYGDW